MCGRFVSAAPPDEVARYFSVDEVADTIGGPDSAVVPRWNVAPSTDVLVVRRSGPARRLDAHHWGLVPSWADDPKVGNRMINARAETLATSGAFKHAFRRRRCLIPADGFYEWAARPGQRRKQPYFVHRPDGEPYAFAGLWEVWRPDGADEQVAPLRSCTIVTTAANEAVAPLHDRMPVILPPSAWEAWLDRGNDDVVALARLLVAAPTAITALRPVATDVGDVKVDGPHLIDPIDPDLDAAAGVTGGSGGGVQGTLL